MRGVFIAKAFLVHVNSTALLEGKKVPLLKSQMEKVVRSLTPTSRKLPESSK